MLNALGFPPWRITNSVCPTAIADTGECNERQTKQTIKQTQPNEHKQTLLMVVAHVHSRVVKYVFHIIGRSQASVHWNKLAYTEWLPQRFMFAPKQREKTQFLICIYELTEALNKILQLSFATLRNHSMAQACLQNTTETQAHNTELLSSGYLPTAGLKSGNVINKAASNSKVLHLKNTTVKNARSLKTSKRQYAQTLNNLVPVLLSQQTQWLSRTIWLPRGENMG
jgi:hypothetical protein